MQWSFLYRSTTSRYQDQAKDVHTKARTKRIANAEASPEARPKKGNPKPAVPQELTKWRKKKLRSKADPFRQCHTCWQLFSCGHRHRTLCRACDLSWDRGQSISCPLYRMRVEERWEPGMFIIYLSEPCGICPRVDHAYTGQSAQEQSKHFYLLPNHIWDLLQETTLPKVLRTIQDLFDNEADFMIEKQLEEKDEEEISDNNGGVRSWDRNLLAWEELVSDYRDFRRVL